MRARRVAISALGGDAGREVRVTRVAAVARGGCEITFGRGAPAEPPRREGAIGEQRRGRGRGAQRVVGARAASPRRRRTSKKKARRSAATAERASSCAARP